MPARYQFLAAYLAALPSTVTCVRLTFAEMVAVIVSGGREGVTFARANRDSPFSASAPACPCLLVLAGGAGA